MARLAPDDNRCIGVDPHRSGPAIQRHRSRQDFETPQIFMNAVVARFGPISWDLAAHHGTTKHENFFSKENDSLKMQWHRIPGLLWLNPPFDKIGPWAKKCAEESALGAKIMLLVPASVGSNWFRDHVHGKAFVHFLNGRLAFDPLHPNWGYPKDTMLCCYGVGPAGFDVWNWRDSTG
jgi:phage N-6-adenine-methyltransferase